MSDSNNHWDQATIVAILFIGGLIFPPLWAILVIGGLGIGLWQMAKEKWKF